MFVTGLYYAVKCQLLHNREPTYVRTTIQFGQTNKLDVESLKHSNKLSSTHLAKIQHRPFFESPIVTPVTSKVRNTLNIFK